MITKYSLISTELAAGRYRVDLLSLHVGCDCILHEESTATLFYNTYDWANVSFYRVFKKPVPSLLKWSIVFDTLYLNIAGASSLSRPTKKINESIGNLTPFDNAQVSKVSQRNYSVIRFSIGSLMSLKMLSKKTLKRSPFSRLLIQIEEWLFWIQAII